MKKTAILFSGLAALSLSASDLTVPPADFAQWYSYPAGALKAQISKETKNAAKALQFDLRKSCGHINYRIPARTGEILKSITFSAKALPANKLKTQDILILEADNEIYYSTIKLSNEWQNYSIDLDKMQFFPYGGTKKADGILNRKNAKVFRFNNYPKDHAFLLADLVFHYEPDPAFKTVKIAPTAEQQKKWYCYPAGKLTAKLADDLCKGEKSFHIDLRKSAGHLDFLLKPEPGFVLRNVSFYAKALADSKPEGIEMHLCDADDEHYFSLVKLTKDWKFYSFDAAKLPIYPYGGATLKDGKLNLERVVKFLFNNYPSGRNFLISHLTFLYEKGTMADLQKAAHKEIRYEEVPFPAKYEKKHSMLPPLQDITAGKGSFLKDGKPYFMLGMWQMDCETGIWLMSLYNADVTVFNGDEIYSLYGPRRNAKGEPVFSWTANPWYEAVMSRLCQNHVRVWHEHKAGPEFSVMKRVPEAADLWDAGHFVPYDPYHPLGETFYRQMFKNWMRHTRKYPLFCYEVFNEMGYFNFHKSSRDKFRELMHKKFGTVAKLNAAYGTKFKSFADLDAPGYLQDHGLNKLPRETMTRREGMKYPNLMTDWVKFQEDSCYNAVKKLMPAMRSYDPDKKVLSTIQAHLNLGLDYGNGGVPPEALTDFSDFYSHELGQAFAETGKVRDYNYIIGMLKPMFINEFVQGVAKTIPVFNAESPFDVQTRGCSEEFILQTTLCDMHANWKFFDATKTGLPAGWTEEKFDDSKWGKIKVPAMWAESGYNLASIGLYRKNFTLKKSDLKGPLYLNGKGFADAADIYLNGKFVGKVNGYDAKFTFDISKIAKEKNQISVRILNNYFYGGMYYGGIRGFVSVNNDELVPGHNYSVEPKHIRSYAWSQAAHGISGIMYSYDAKEYMMSARYLPTIKAELESVADLLYKMENRPVSGIALVYPIEDLRGIIHKDYLLKLAAPATKNILPYFTAFVPDKLNPTVIRQKNIAQDDVSKFKMLVAPNLKRVQPEAYGKLVSYVRNGGILVMSVGGFSVSEETHLPFDSSALSGVKEGKELPAGKVKIKGFGEGLAAKRYIDGIAGRELIPVSAKPYLVKADGTPAATVHKLGKGKVYVLGMNFDGPFLEKILRSIAKENGIVPALRLAAIKGHFLPEYADVRLFGKGSSRLLYALNFDLPGAAKVHFAEKFDSYWRLRSVQGNKLIKSPSGRELWSSSEIAKGIPLRLNRFETVAILMERSDIPARKMTGIAPERLAMLNELWKDVPAKKGQPNVVLTQIQTMTTNHGVIPTARKVLTDNGFNVRELTVSDRISRKDTDILIVQNLGREYKDVEGVRKFVADGGGLMICGGGFLNYHTANNCWKLLKAFGFSEGGLFVTLYNKNDNPPGDNMTLHCTNIAKDHPVTANVSDFVTSCCNVLTAYPKNAKILIRAPKSSDPQERPVMAAVQYGKGRVIFFGDCWSLRPLYFERGNNAQFFYNAVSWLAGKNAKKLSAADLEKSLFITADRIAKAREQEKNGIFTYDQPEMYKSYLKSSDAAGFSGLKGGDPVIDMLKSAF